MKYRATKKDEQDDNRIADPETVLKAAEAAPAVFSIGAYFPSIYRMREKGHPWRYLADEWLPKFNIKISHVHLHRLYLKEDARLDRLTFKELRALGMPTDMIQDRQEKRDPSKRLVAPDSEDEPDDGEGEDHA